MLVDTLGFVLAAEVTAANLNDREGFYMLLGGIKKKYPRLKKIWADMGYQGETAKIEAAKKKIHLEIVSRKERKFKVEAKRWIVERTIAWINRFRRLSKDYEQRVSSSVAMIYIVTIRLLFKRLLKLGI